MVNLEEFKNYLQKMLSETYGVEEFNFGMGYNLKKELDSLDMLEMIVNIENEYDVVFQYEDIDSIETIGDLVEKFEILKNK